jgi:RNA polymerase I-specific transcription initiation factor RRN3
LTKTYPFSRETAKTHVEFASNVIKIIAYAPEMRNTILGLLTERIVKLDLEIQDELDEDFEARADEVMQEILQQNAKKDEDDDSDSDASDESDDEGESGSVGPFTEEQKKFMAFKDSVDKLDALLDLLFAYYDSIFQKGASPNASAVFEHMMTQFKHNILPTHHSRYTQFIIFHFAQTSEHFVDRFVEVCWSVLADKSSPVMLRLAASSYLGSFIARGAKVSVDVVRYSTDLLLNYLNEQRIKAEQVATGPDLRRFSSFYAIFQVLLYIYCFRWRDLLDNEDPDDDETIIDIVYHHGESHWFPGLKQSLERAMLSTMNPFKICAPGIVDQFVKLSHNFSFISARHVAERNKTIRVVRPTIEAAAAVSARETALSGALGDVLQLDDYFPFDPYYLPKSKRWIEGDYVEWQDPEGLRHGDDDEEDRVSDSSAERHGALAEPVEEDEFEDESEDDSDDE